MQSTDYIKTRSDRKMSKAKYKRRIINVVHPDGRDMTMRIVFRKINDFVVFLDKHFDKGYKIKKAERVFDMPTVYLTKEKDKSLSCGVK